MKNHNPIPPNKETWQGFKEALISHHMGASAVPTGSPICAVWRKCVWLGVSLFFTLLVNMVVCSEYTKVPLQGQIHALHTWLFYSYFASQCCGAVLALVPVIRSCLSVHVILMISIVRFGGVAAIYEYNQRPQRFEGVSDWGVRPSRALVMMQRGLC